MSPGPAPPDPDPDQPLARRDADWKAWLAYQERYEDDDHRLKQHPRWHVDQLPDGTFRWTTPAGRQYVTEPTRYPT